MTLEEFTDYVLALSAQVAGEPSASPIMDAGMVVEFLLPAVLREATRDAFKNDRYLEGLIKEHELIITAGSSPLPTGLEEEFVRSFQVSIGEMRDRVVHGSWDAVNSKFTLDFGAFGTADVGKLCIVKDPTGAVLARAFAASRTGGGTLLLDIAAGVGVTANCTITLYNATWTPLKSINGISMTNGSSIATVGSGFAPDCFLPEDTGRLISILQIDGSLRTITIIRSSNLPTVATLWEKNNGPDDIVGGSAQISKYVPARSKVGFFSHYPHYAEFLGITGDIMPRFCVRDGSIYFKDANDVEISDGTFMYVEGVTVPQVPTLATDDIPAPEALLDDCMSLVSAIIRGERSLQSVGIDPEKVQ